MRTILIVLKVVFMAGCAVAIFGALSAQVERIDPRIPVALPAWLGVVGVVLLAAGAVLMLLCFGLFSAGGSLSPHDRFPDPRVFISWGPYRFVRNPMAKGGFTVLCGWGLYQLSPSILLLAVLLAAAMHLFVVYVEEPKLERRFGESYREYKRRVPRWIPSWRAPVR